MESHYDMDKIPNIKIGNETQTTPGCCHCLALIIPKVTAMPVAGPQETNAIIVNQIDLPATPR